MKLQSRFILFLSAAFFVLFLVSSGSLFAKEPPVTEWVVAPSNAAGFLQAIADVKSMRDQGVKSKVTLIVPAGKYHFEKTIVLTPEIVGNGLKIIANKETANQPRATSADDVIFSGGVPLTARKHGAKGNWRFPLPANEKGKVAPRTILINHQMQSAARFPKQGYLRIEKPLADKRSGFIVNKDDLPKEFDLSTGDCDLVFLHDWSSSRLPIASYDAKVRTLKTVGLIGCAARHYSIDHFEKKPRYYLEGHSSFANAPGEWYFDNSTNEIVVIASDSKSKPPSVLLPRLIEILVASGTEKTPLRHLTIQGITFTGTKFPMPAGGLAGAQATMHEPRNAKGLRLVKNRPMVKAAVKIERADHCQIINSVFRALGGTGVSLAGQTNHCTIKRCKVQHVGGNGINLGEDRSRRVKGKSWVQSAPEQVPTQNKVERCEVSFCGEMLLGSVGIWASLHKQLEVTNNHIHDTPYTGISLGWVWNDSQSPARENVIRDNRIEFVMQTLSDGGGIYTLGKQPGSVIEKNLITDIPLNAGRAEANGMFLDEGSTGFTIRKNTIRRVDKSPLRFHQTGKNHVTGNRWELQTEKTPPLRFNSTPEKNITITNNTVLKKQKQLYFIGNSLTWDTIPPLLDERPLWHVDCGKPLKYIFDHPENPCVSTSRNWPVALKTTQFDFISFQPHYGKSIEEDFETICQWIDMQHKAVIIIHTGWAHSATSKEEWEDKDPAGKVTHSKICLEELLKRLRAKYPAREFRSTYAMYYLQQIEQDIQTKKAPFEKLEEIYRDAIHMKVETGRYLMHNVVRKTLGQPQSANGFPKADTQTIEYLNELLKKDFR